MNSITRPRDTPAADAERTIGLNRPQPAPDTRPRGRERMAQDILLALVSNVNATQAARLSGDLVAVAVRLADELHAATKPQP